MLEHFAEILGIPLPLSTDMKLLLVPFMAAFVYLIVDNLIRIIYSIFKW